MPVYNGEMFIYEQIESVLKQLSIDDEFVISDDDSTDKTCEIIESFKDARIKLIKNKGHKSPVLNMENAINHSKGSLIFMCDQDDVWLKDKVKLMSECLKKTHCVVSDAIVTDSNLKVIYNSRYRKGLLQTKNKYLSLLMRPAFHGCCMAFRREVLSKVLPFPDNIQSHDTWIGYVCAFYFSVSYIDDKLILYRRHANNASTATTGKSLNTISKRVFFRWQYVKSLIKLFL